MDLAPVQVDMSEEEDEFQGVITQCLGVLVLGIETRMDPALAAMARMPWATMEAVSLACTDWTNQHAWSSWSSLLCRNRNDKEVANLM